MTRKLSTTTETFSFKVIKNSVQRGECHECLWCYSHFLIFRETKIVIVTVHQEGRDKDPYRHGLMYCVDCTVLVHLYYCNALYQLPCSNEEHWLPDGKNTLVHTSLHMLACVQTHTHTRVRLNWVQGKVWFILAIRERKRTSFSV